MLLPRFPELGWALCPTVPPSTEVSFPNRPTFPLPLGVGPPSTGTSVRISLSGQPGLGEAYPLRPAHPSRSWDSAARPACLASARAVQRGPRNTGEESAGCRHGHVREGRGKSFPVPGPCSPRGTGWGHGGEFSSQKLVPESPRGPPRGCPPAPGGSASLRPARGTRPGRRGRGSRRLPRGVRPAWWVLTAGCTAGRVRRRTPSCGARSRARRGASRRRLLRAPPAPPLRHPPMGGAGAGRGRRTQIRRDYDPRGGAESVPAPRSPPGRRDFALRGRERWPQVHACVSRG